MEEKNYWLEGSSKATCMDKLKRATLGFIHRRFDVEDILDDPYDDILVLVADDDGETVMHIVLIMEGFDAKTPTRRQFEALLVELIGKEGVPGDCAISMDCAQYNVIDPENSAILRFIEHCQEFGCVIDDDSRC